MSSENSQTSTATKRAHPIKKKPHSKRMRFGISPDGGDKVFSGLFSASFAWGCVNASFPFPTTQMLLYISSFLFVLYSMV